MKNRTFSAIKFAATVSLAACVSWAPANAEEVTLSALSFLPNHTANGKPFAEWVEKINKDAKGLVQIDLKASGSMSPFTMGNAVKSGVVDLVHLPHAFYQNLLPIGDAMKLSRMTPQQLRDNGTIAFMNELHNAKLNAEYLGHWGFNVPFHIYLRDKKMEKLSLKGLKLRITPVYRAFFRALGADMIQMPPSDVYTALERGSVDGLGWPVWDIKSFGWDKKIKYRVDPGFYGTTPAFLLHLPTWRKLDKKQQDYLKATFREMEDVMWERAKELNEFYRKQQAESGVQSIRFSPEVEKEYLRIAYESGWNEAIKLDPVNGPKLRKLIGGGY